MPSPSSSLATQRPDLAESFMEFDLAMDANGYVANKVFPIVEVQSQAGVFGKIPLEELLTEIETKRAPGSGYARDTFEFETATYACVEHGAEDKVDRREAEMYREYFDAEVIAAQRAYSKVLRNAEKRVADAVFNTSTFTGASLFTDIDAGANTAWATTASSVPIDDVEAAVRKVYDNSGVWPNALVMNYKTFRLLRTVDQVIDAISSSGAGDKSTAREITTAQLAEVFDLDHIIVSGASRNSAKRGQTASPAQIWSDSYVMVCKVATGQDFREPCIGRTFHWSQDGSSPGGTVEQYYEEAVRSDIYRVRHDVDEVLLYPQMGHLLQID